MSGGLPALAGGEKPSVSVPIVATWNVSSLRSILKGRDITLPTKVCLFKAVGFPVSHIWM